MTKIVCTEQFSNRIMICDPSVADWNKPEARLWTFNPYYHQDIPIEKLRFFGAVSEVKPVLNNTVLLLTASSGVVCLVNIEEDRVIFCEFASGNTHSADLLPDGNVVTASSTGSYLRLFFMSADMSHAERYVDFPAEDAHGVVWDNKRNCLWSSGLKGLIRWTYRNGELIQEQLFEPRPGNPFHGHDLYPVRGEDALYLTGYDVLRFDPENGSFQTVLAGPPYVKSISRAANGAVLVTTPQQHWWTDTVSLLTPDGVKPYRTMSNMRFYKARFMD